jgi:hypothetical protein
MSASDDPRRVHFQSPEYLVDRLDAIADLFDTDRTDLLVEAIREYIEETANSDSVQELVATKYYNGQLDFETAEQLVGTETAQRLRLLKRDLDDEPLDLDAPTDEEIYDGDAVSVDSDVGDRAADPAAEGDADETGAAPEADEE